jgi:hypothetical protein
MAYGDRSIDAIFVSQTFQHEGQKRREVRVSEICDLGISASLNSEPSIDPVAKTALPPPTQQFAL